MLFRLLIMSVLSEISLVVYLHNDTLLYTQ